LCRGTGKTLGRGVVLERSVGRESGVAGVNGDGMVSGVGEVALDGRGGGAAVHSLLKLFEGDRGWTGGT